MNWMPSLWLLTWHLRTDSEFNNRKLIRNTAVLLSSELQPQITIFDAGIASFF